MVETPLIAIVPVGDVPRKALTDVGPILAASLGAKVVLAPGIALVSSAYNAQRRQYHSTQILQTLAGAKQRDGFRVRLWCRSPMNGAL